MSGEMLAGQDTPVEQLNEAQNLQPEQQNTGTTEAQTDGAEGGKESPAKTFTQDEVNAIVAREKAREARKALRELQRLQPQQEPHAQQPNQPQQAHRPQVTKADIEAYLEEQRSHEAIAAFTEKAEDAAEKYPDYIRTVTDPRVPFSSDMVEFFAESDVGVDLAYQLAKNPAKVHEILRMSPLKAGRELSRLEAEIKAKPIAKPSKAPEPISPVGRRASSTASALPSDDDDIETWMRKERERVRNRR